MLMPIATLSLLLRGAGLSLVMLAFASVARADTVLVAVAANFAAAAKEIAHGFALQTGHTAVVTTGATGKLYAQITQGAPFEVLLSADATTPARLEAEGFAVPESVFAYAIGKLTLWSAEPGRIGDDPKLALTDTSLRFLAIANPDLAPYGTAAREVMQGMGIWDALQGRLVMGQNIGQTFGLVQSGAADAGFVARSALDAPGTDFGGSRWDVPDAMFTPLQQNAALLIAGVDNPAAAAFLAYLAGDDARATIAAFGYGVPE